MDESESSKPVRRRAPSSAKASAAGETPQAPRKTPAKKAPARSPAPKARAAAEPAARSSRSSARKPEPGPPGTPTRAVARESAAAAPARRSPEQVEFELESKSDDPARFSPLPAFLAQPEETRAAPPPEEGSARALRVIDWLSGRLPAPWSRRVRDLLLAAGADRPADYLLLLWPSWWALWFAAHGMPPIGLLLAFSLGVLLLRAAGSMLVRWFAARAARTRPRADALIPAAFALALVAVLLLATDSLARWLALAGLGIALAWPLARRVPALALLLRGFGLSWSIPLAFAVVGDSLPPLAWLLLVGGVLFVAVQGCERALAGTADGRALAALFADADRGILGVLMATFLLAMALAGARAGLGWVYFLAVAFAAGFLVWQHRRTRQREPAACLEAWRSNVGLGFVLWLGLLLAFALVGTGGA